MLQFIYKFITPYQKIAFMLEINRLLNSLCECLVSIFNCYAGGTYKNVNCSLPFTANLLRAKIHKISKMIYETAGYLHASMYDYKRCKEMENYIEQTMEMSRKFLSVLLEQTAPKLTAFRTW